MEVKNTEPKKLAVGDCAECSTSTSKSFSTACWLMPTFKNRSIDSIGSPHRANGLQAFKGI